MKQRNEETGLKNFRTPEVVLLPELDTYRV